MTARAWSCDHTPADTPLALTFSKGRPGLRLFPAGSPPCPTESHSSSYRPMLYLRLLRTPSDAAAPSLSLQAGERKTGETSTSCPGTLSGALGPAFQSGCSRPPFSHWLPRAFARPSPRLAKFMHAACRSKPVRNGLQPHAGAPGGGVLQWYCSCRSGFRPANTPQQVRPSPDFSRCQVPLIGGFSLGADDASRRGKVSD